MKNYSDRQKDKMRDLLSDFFSGTLTPGEKNELYRYVADSRYKDEVIAWLRRQWECETFLREGDIPGEAMFAKIREEIERKANDKEASRQSRARQPKAGKRRLPVFLRYAAVFVAAFGISWAAQKIMTADGPAYPPVAINEEPTYNEILVPYGSKTKVVLSDSTKVWLNAGSRLKYPTRFSGDLREVHLQGEGYFDVTKDSEHPFLVNTNGMNVKVLGTKFNLTANADDSRMEVVLVEGAVEIPGLKDTESASQNNVVLTPGQKITLYKEKGGYKIRDIQGAGLSIPEEATVPVRITSANLTEKVNVEMSTAWTKDKLIFFRERFEDVKTKLERRYDVHIEVNDPEISDYRFTGTFEKETFEQVMTALSKAASCSFRVNKNNVAVFKKK